MTNFNPVLRFLAVSDVHYKDEHSKEREYMAKALKTSYEIAHNHPTYKKLDAVVVAGDFATSGTQIQMDAFKKTLDDGLEEGTQPILLISSHEFKGEGGMQGGFDRFTKTFSQNLDQHNVINGFHFISVSSNNGAGFTEEKVEFMTNELKRANDDDPKKPIFVFQHPHLQSTVYGSILWGEEDFNREMMNYPQVIDFSGHSHAPINDPRSIHQQYYTALGTGTFSYFELDEFDKICGTVPENSGKAAQMTIVEVDKDNRVRIFPYDLITDNFFPMVWKIDKPYDVDSFLYTDEKRYKNPPKVYFEEGAKIDVTADETSCTVTFAQAKSDSEYVNGYEIRIKTKDGITEKCIAVWSEYYFYDMPESLTKTIGGLKPNTEYVVEIKAHGFWKNYSNVIKKEFKTK